MLNILSFYTMMVYNMLQEKREKGKQWEPKDILSYDLNHLLDHEDEKGALSLSSATAILKK